MCRCNHTHINRNMPGTAHRVNHAFLQDAQQLYLHLGRHIADLIEKQCAAVGQLKPAFAVSNRAGKSAFAMTKQFALEQVFGNRCAIDRNKSCFSPGRPIVKGLRDQFFAATAFPANQNGGGATGG